MANAAAASQVHLSPPPSARRTVPWLACAHIAWTAVSCLWVASMWLFSWAMAATEIGWLACGVSCPVVTASFNVVFAAVVTLVLVGPFSLLGARMLAHEKAAAVVPVAAAAAATDDTEATKEPALTLKKCYAAIRALTLKKCYAAMRGALRDPLTLGFLALTVFTLLVIIALLVAGEDKPVMGSRRAVTCSVIYHVGAVGMNVVDCFVLCPLITLKVWRFWRKARYAL